MMPAHATAELNLAPRLWSGARRMSRTVDGHQRTTPKFYNILATLGGCAPR